MKKTLPILVSSAAIMACLLASCSRPGTEAQSVDSTKSQLRVKYFNGGLRDEWINQLVDDFEAKYADYSFESGKKGVQIIKEFVKSNPQVSGINSSSNDVFWVEDTDYYDAVSKGQLL
jgi:ABC-type glycerol-3-phosphate transport system substrate-binding protein